MWCNAKVILNVGVLISVHLQGTFSTRIFLYNIWAPGNADLIMLGTNIGD